MRSGCLLLMRALGLLTLAGCATQPPAEPPTGAVTGFFLGLFHGATLFFAFVASLFTEYRVYAYPNAGGWYDLGFLIGVMAVFGGSGRAATR